MSNPHIINSLNLQHSSSNIYKSVIDSADGINVSGFNLEGFSDGYADLEELNAYIASETDEDYLHTATSLRDLLEQSYTESNNPSLAVRYTQQLDWLRVDFIDNEAEVSQEAPVSDPPT